MAPPLCQLDAPAAMERRRPWRLDWLTPLRCRLIFGLLVALGFFSHLWYLLDDCPLDLAGDEAHYWDWSRHLGLSYYSKGPAVAYLIRASCALFGDAMWAVRLPAILFAVGTSILTYWLTRRLFDSDRLALGATALGATVPMFVAGSILMTIDPPFFFCWAAATCLAVPALLGGKAWAWPAMGAVVGLGFLAKYAMFLWPVGPAIFILIDPAWRAKLRTPGPWLRYGTMWGVALLFTAPVALWNARNGWPSVKHVAHQTGADAGGFPLNFVNLFEYVAGQIGAVGPILAGFMALGVWAAWRTARRRQTPESRGLLLLLAIGLPMLGFCALTALRAKVQVNWPAPAYFTLMIVAAWWLATRLQSVGMWKPVRGWFWASIFLGVLFTPLAHHMDWTYPAIAWANRTFGTRVQVRRIDPTYRLRGHEEFGADLGRDVAALGPGAFVLCEDYQTAALASFYMPGRPTTYCCGSYFTGALRRRLSQYDFWPDHDLDQPKLIGENAVYVGYVNADLRAAFERVEEMPDVRVVRHGVFVRRFQLWKCIGFKGMTRPPTAGERY